MDEHQHMPTVPAASERLDDKVYTVSFIVPSVLQLIDTFDEMVHDEALAHAHAKGYIPIGPMFIDVGVIEEIVQRPLPRVAKDDERRKQAEHMFSKMPPRIREEAIAGFLGEPVSTDPVVVNQIKITASMQVGLVL